jgi:branched-chain amino acid transport system substrate-binding protein
VTVARRAALGLALAAALGSPLVPRRARAQAVPIVLGALYPFSGALAVLGDESFRGLELAVEERNSAGGLLGRPIRLVKGDAVSAKQAPDEVRRLIGTEHVSALLGTFESRLAAAATPIAELAGIPYFELGAVADPIMDRGFKYLFRSCPVASALAALTVAAVTDELAPLWAVDSRDLKLAIVAEDGLYGTTVSGWQAKACRDRGLHVVESLSYSAASTDLANAVQRLRAAAADVVLFTGYANDTVAFFRQFIQSGWRPRMVVGAGGGMALQDTANAVGPDFEGAVCVGFTPYAVNVAAAPGAQSVQAYYERKYGTKPRSGHSLANYVGARLFLDAIGRAGSLDKDKLRATILATDVADGTTANGWGARFDERGQNLRASPVLMQWQDGAPLTVLPPNAAVSTLRPNMGA